MNSAFVLPDITRCIVLSHRIGRDEVALIARQVRAIVLESGTTDPITLVIDSRGGPVGAVLAVVAFLRSLPMLINTHGIGSVAGSAIAIMAAGTGQRVLDRHAVVVAIDPIADSRNEPFGAPAISHVPETGEDFAVHDPDQDIAILLDQFQGDEFYLLLEELTKTESSDWRHTFNPGDVIEHEDCVKFGIVDEVV